MAKKSKNIFNLSSNGFLLLLLFAYVFLAPFEDLLEYLYGIDTVLKPYRVAGIFLLIFGFFYKFKEKPFLIWKEDKYIIYFFLWGVIWTSILWLLTNRIDAYFVLNSMIQVSFFLMIHLTIKRIDMTYKTLEWVMVFFVAGLVINASVISFDYYFLALGSRVQGLSDNSNYAAYSMAIACVYLMYRIMRNQFRLFSLANLFFVALLVFMFFSILATGSRGGFVIFGAGIFLLTIWFGTPNSRARIVPLLGLAVLVIVLNAGLASSATNASTFNRFETATEDVRFKLWHAAFNALVDSWGMGIGVGQIMVLDNFEKYMNPVDRNIVIDLDNRGRGLGMHNLFVDVSVEAGFICVIFMLLFFYALFRYQYRLYRFSAHRDIHRMFLVFMCCQFIMSMTGKGLFGALFWFVFTVSSLVIKEDEQPKIENVNE